MRLLTGFATEQEARDKSEQLFLPYRHPTSQTRYLVGWKQHPDTGEWALVVPAEHEEMLPIEDSACLEDDNWPIQQAQEAIE